MKYFPISSTEISALSKADVGLEAAITRIGFIKRRVNPDAFASTVEAVVAQQISSKVAVAVVGKIAQKFGGLGFDRLKTAKFCGLRECGLSAAKAECVLSLVRAQNSGDINFSTFSKLSDCEIRNRLCALRGIGNWTVEMVLIFSLLRPDILSFADFGIRRGLEILRGEKPDKKSFEKFRAACSPFGSTASLYLWEIAGGGLSKKTIKL